MDQIAKVDLNLFLLFLGIYIYAVSGVDFMKGLRLSPVSG